MTIRIASQMPLTLLDGVREAHPDVVLFEVGKEGAPSAEEHADILLALPWGTPNLPELLASGIQWVHAYGTGVNGFPFEALNGIPLSCSRGASGRAISEWVLAVMLAEAKGLPENWIKEPVPRWNTAEVGTLAGRTLALVGLGGIAQGVARRALPFEMRVKALRRTSAPSPVPDVEVVTELDALLDGADHVVIAAPATPATHHLINDAAFAAMKPGVHLINVARGGLVDQDALRRALDREIVGRASLDCVDPEPLPKGHWLYEHPRVRLSPHVSWLGLESHTELISRFVENIDRFKRGEPLAYLVDPEEGY